MTRESRVYTLRQVKCPAAHFEDQFLCDPSALGCLNCLIQKEVCRPYLDGQCPSAIVAPGFSNAYDEILVIVHLSVAAVTRVILSNGGRIHGSWVSLDPGGAALPASADIF